MPLLKKRPLPIAEPPADLRPDERVWQVRFTKEIFRSYPEYLERMNLFRQRVWSCRITGKKNLTYEEALISEEQINKKLLEFPQMYTAYVLQMVQFSMLKLNDLVTMIADNLSETFMQGEELLGSLDNSYRPCKILKVLSSKGGASYKVGWLNEKGEVTTTSVLDASKLTRKKFPFSRSLLKLFIKESTFQDTPWVIHDKLAKKYGITTKCPKELRAGVPEEMVEIEYPIEDLMVKSSPEDPAFTTRPLPSDKFHIPSENIGNLLLVWDFLSCFSKLLRLSPFSVDEFESAIAYEGASDLINEAHFCLLTLLINDHGEYYNLIQETKREEVITLKDWSEYLCDFLELENETKFANHSMMIRKGYYSMLGVDVKLEILLELVHAAISTGAVRERLDFCFEQQQDLVARKKEEDLEEARKRREEKRLKATEGGGHESQQDSDLKGDDHESHQETNLKGLDQSTCDSMNTSKLAEDDKNRTSKLDVLKSRRISMKKNLEEKTALELEKEASRLEELKRLREEHKAKSEVARLKKLKEERLIQFEREIEKVQILTVSLGKDRDHNIYWFFHRDGRLFVESADHRAWGYYSSKEEVDMLMGSLNPKGVRELSLWTQLEKSYSKICTALQKRSKELTQRVDVEDTSVLRRSVRVSALPKDENKVPSFLRYVNKLRTK